MRRKILLSILILMSIDILVACWKEDVVNYRFDGLELSVMLADSTSNEVIFLNGDTVALYSA